MSNDSLRKNCNCPMDCESIGYSSYYVSSPFNSEELCSRQPNGLMEKFVRNFKKFKGLVSGNNLTSDANEICLKNIQYKAEITFQLATNTIYVTVISRRLSFFHKLSGFGKYIHAVFDVNFTF